MKNSKLKQNLEKTPVELNWRKIVQKSLNDHNFPIYDDLICHCQKTRNFESIFESVFRDWGIVWHKLPEPF